MNVIAIDSVQTIRGCSVVVFYNGHYRSFLIKKNPNLLKILMMFFVVIPIKTFWGKLKDNLKCKK